MISGSLSSYPPSGNSTGKVAFAGTAVVEASAKGVMIGKIRFEAQSATMQLSIRANAKNSQISSGGLAAVSIGARAPELRLKVLMNASALIELTGHASLPNPTYLQVNKTFYFKVKRDGQYVTTIKPTEGIDDLKMKLGINSNGSEIKLKFKRPADDFGSDFDMRLANVFEVYVTDRQVPNGKRIFTGELIDHEADYLDDTLEITLRGFGDETNHYIIESGQAIAQAQQVQNDQVGIGVTATAADFEHKMVFASTYKLSRLRYRLCGNSFVTPGDPNQGGGQDVVYTGQTVYLRLYNSEADLRAGVNFQYVATVRIDSADYKEYSFEFPAPIQVTNGQTMYAKLSVSQNVPQGQQPTTLVGLAAGNVDTASTSYIGASGYPSSWQALTKDVWFEAYSSTGSTEAAYNSVDPADILRSILDDYISRGGTLRYTADSIDDTNSLVSYTFKTNTLSEGIAKVLELCPEGWYYYIDQADNIVHLHKRSVTPDHTFVIGRHLTQLKVKNSLDPIVNKIHFVGGGDPNYYKKYVAPVTENSLKRERAIRLKDGRVTLEETADILAKRSFQLVPGVYLRIGIGDNNIHVDKGYDLETIVPGQVIRLGSTGDSRAARYDQAKFDEDVFDYDPANVGTQDFQIIDFDYSATEVVMQVSNIAYDVNKRTSDIKRNLKDEQFSNTPAVPET